MHLILALFLALVGGTAAAQPMPVVASFSILADITAQVGGDRIKVTSLVGPDQDAHVYQPTPADSRVLAGAKVVVTNGLGFEGWIERLIKASGTRAEIVVATQNIRTRRMADAHGHAHGKDADPHVWHDPRRMMRYADNIAAGLAKADPAGAEVYRNGAQSVAVRLAAMDSWAEARFAEVPAAKRKLITSHDSFGYLAERFRLTIRAPRGITTGAEPSAKSIATLIDQIRKEGIKAVFVENITDRRLVEQLAREAGVTVGGRLYSDALSGTDGPARSYEALFRHNVALITSAMLQN
ncbi:MAG: metal ABC transporter substrate-binding protein [Alphaproteobacteria bacterium]|nr:metal ABC transporter substrate-binding protein [Alphaproteobacteria bacterium]